MTDQNTPIGVSNTPFYVREHKPFAIEQERYRHDQGIYSLGEYCLFVLMWSVEDYERGYTTRCQRCFAGNSLDSRTSNVYKQSTQENCPECFGTTFTGGVRAKIIRPILLTDSDDDEKPAGNGVIHPQTINLETTSDFRYRQGDYIFRIDGSRWQLTAPSRITLRTGFQHPNQVDDSLGYVRGVCSLEDETSVAYMIPPYKDQLSDILHAPDRYPSIIPPQQWQQFNAGPSIPNGVTD